MKIIVISLARAKQRRSAVIKQLETLQLEYRLFDAVDAQTNNFLDSDMRRDKATKQRLGYTLVDGEIACFASHREVWRICVEENEPILVLEDNVLIDSKLAFMLSDLSLLCERYDYIKLFAYFSRKGIVVEQLSNNMTIEQSYKRYSGAQGYTLTPNAARNFIHQSQRGFFEPVDDFMEKPYLHKVHTVLLQPNLLHRAPIASTISSSNISRKDKTGLAFRNKLTIELFRIYEKIRNYLARNKRTHL